MNDSMPRRSTLALFSALSLACERKPAPVVTASTETRSLMVALDAGRDAGEDAAASADADLSESDALEDAASDDSARPSGPYLTRGGVAFSFEREVFEGEATPAAARPSALETPERRSGAPPAARALYAALSRTLASRATYALQGGFNAIGDGRFVSVVQQTRRGALHTPSLVVVVSSESAGAAQVEGYAELPTRDVWSATDGVGRALSVDGRELRDFDNDGELELSLALSYSSAPVCGTGSTSFAYLAVVDLLPTPTIAAMVQRENRPDAITFGRRALRTRWSDTNGDGRLDIVVEGEDCAWVDGDAARRAATLGCDRFEQAPEIAQAGLCCVRRREVALYNERWDAWRPARPGASGGELIPCEDRAE
jgi:hypothetical protein